MRLRHTLAATAAAFLLTVGVTAQAQQSMPPAGGTKAAPAERQAPPVMDRGSSTKVPSNKLDSGAYREVKKGDKDKVMAPKLGVNAKDLEDMNLYGTDGKKIGKVDKALADNSDEIKAVTVDVGGFLGIGTKEVLISLDNLHKGPENRLQTSMTKKEIESLGEWKGGEKTGRKTIPGRTPGDSPMTSPSSK